MSAMTKREWMAYLEKTWDAAQKEAWSDQQPTKREWVGLTAPEVQECYDLNPARFASRIEAKLKEKNHG